ncbi:MAG: MMPL family transporter, partial [Chloroflexi bacterium]|nr:MMPL family transporter [Chloroflexota bacterium]
MLGALTDFVSSPRGKWVTLLVWVLVAGALLSQLPRLDEVRENEEALFLPGDAESTLAFELARDEFPARGTPTLIVFREPAGLGDATLAAVDDLVAWLTRPDAPDNITDVRAPGAIPGLVSPDRTTLYIFVELSGEPAEEPFADTINAIRDRTAALDLPGVEVAVGGPGGLVVDIVGVFRQIDTFLLLVTVALVLALLIAIYRSPIVAAIPLLGVGLVFQLAGGIAAFIAREFELPISGQATGIMTVVLFGTGTDYVLFVSARFREELTRHGDRHEAMRRTMRGVGGAVASAGATILVASAALWLAILRSYQTLGPVIALAVALMMLAALTLIPAVLTILGRRAFWPLQPRVAEGDEAPTDWRKSIYGRIGGVVLRRPRVVLAVTSGVLALLIAGLFAYQPTYDRLESLPENTESVRSFELLRTGFPGGELARTRVFVSLASGAQALDADVLEQLDAVTLALVGHPLVAGAAGPSRPFGIEAGFGGGPAADAARAGFGSPGGGAGGVAGVLGGGAGAAGALAGTAA